MWEREIANYKTPSSFVLLTRMDQTTLGNGFPLGRQPISRDSPSVTIRFVGVNRLTVGGSVN